MNPRTISRDVMIDAQDIAYHLPRYLAYMAMRTPDGRPTQSGGANVSGGDISNPVLSAVEGRTEGATPEDLIDTRLPADVVDRVIRNLLMCRNLLREAKDEITSYPRADAQVTPKDRCTGGKGQDGHLEWGDPTCTELADGRPSYDGLGIACYHRRRRWRIAKGLAA